MGDDPSGAVLQLLQQVDVEAGAVWRRIDFHLHSPGVLTFAPYRVVRVLGEDPRVYELDPDRPVAVRPADLLGPVGGPAIFGQREIYAVSSSEEYRLRLLDDLIGEEAKSHAIAVRESLEALRSNARAILDARRPLAKREEHRQRLKTVEHEISVYEKHGVAAKLKALTTLAGDSQQLRNSSGAVNEAQATWSDAQDAVTAPLRAVVRDLRRGESDQKQILAEAAAAIEKLQSTLHQLYEQGNVAFNETREMLTRLQARWDQAMRPLEDELNKIKLVVQFKGQKDEYRQRLASLLKGSGVSADAIETLTAPEATDGAAIVKAALAGVAAVQPRFAVTAGMAQRIVQWLSADESKAFELEALMPADTLRLELQVDGEYRPLDRLSVGQRATAILLLLFALEGRALVLDQPEDDLDNRFVYEDVVAILRQQKGLSSSQQRRQIIAATHNANIPVLGDAELVLVLEARDGRAHVASRASIDEPGTRKLVKAIMEGGEEAFRRRAEKYGRVWAASE